MTAVVSTEFDAEYREHRLGRASSEARQRLERDLARLLQTATELEAASTTAPSPRAEHVVIDLDAPPAVAWPRPGAGPQPFISNIEPPPLAPVSGGALSSYRMWSAMTNAVAVMASAGVLIVCAVLVFMLALQVAPPARPTLQPPFAPTAWLTNLAHRIATSHAAVRHGPIR